MSTPGARWCAVAGLMLAPILGAPGLGAAGGEGTPLPELPVLDPDSRPIQENYRGWPEDALRERSYWEPWSVGAFNRAALFGRPVLFAMATRWNLASRRMMDGTVSDPRVLRAINDMYVPVFVNPDRRPDIRERYQTGTWPVIAMLLPTGDPMLSRVNEARIQQPITIGPVGVEPMLFLLGEGDEYYRKWRRPLIDVGRAWADRETPDPPVPGAVNAEASDTLARWLMANADREQGGFGLAPKFLVPGLYEYGALRAARGLPELAAHGRLTLQRLLASPLYDASSGGIHRLAGKPDWKAIEYEKMLEPNAQLLRELVLAARLARSTELRHAIEWTARFIRDPLGSGVGGFFVGQRADPASEDGGGYWRGEHDEPPPVEPLVLAGPSAMAGVALLQAGLWLDDDETYDRGLHALEYVIREAYVSGRGLTHVIAPNPNPALRLIWPQADGALAFVEAYEMTGDQRFLDVARDVVGFALANLRVADSELLVDHLPTPDAIGLMRNPRFPLRPNLRLARAMLRLWHLTDEERYFDEALRILGSIAGDLTVFRPWPAEAGLAVEEAISDPLEIVIEGPAGSDARAALARAASLAPWPWRIVRYRESEDVGASLEYEGRLARALSPESLARRVEELTRAPGGEAR